jgi:hypothetical protein
MLEILKTHLRKKTAEIAAAHNTSADNVKICYNNNIFTYQILKQNTVIMEREFNL